MIILNAHEQNKKTAMAVLKRKRFSLKEWILESLLADIIPEKMPDIHTEVAWAREEGSFDCKNVDMA